MSRDFSSGRRPAASWVERTWLVAGVAALAWSGVLAINVRGKVTRVEASVQELGGELARAQAAARGRPSRPQPEVRLAERARQVQEAPPGRIVEELASLLPDDVRFEALALTYDGRAELDLDVVAADAAGYDLFLARLASSPHVADVRPGPESREGELRSRVRIVFRGGRS